MASSRATLRAMVMLTRALTVGLVWAALGAFVPGFSRATEQRIQLRLALAAPRSSDLVLELKRYNEQLRQLTNGRVQLVVYWSGSAGDERAVMRKMRSGQLDGSVFTLPVVSDFVRQALVFEAPALCLRYEQLDAMRAALSPRFNAEAYDNGFKVLAWGDFGRLRFYSQHMIDTPRDFQRTRPWLYPESEVLKELYRVLHVSGVPLDVTEVFGALQTRMIDTFWATSLITSLLQWHRRGGHVSPPFGFLNGALVLTRAAWDGLPVEVQTAVSALVERDALMLQRGFRARDDVAHAKLLARGHRELALRDEQAWWDVGHELRERLVGRVYTRALLNEAEAIARAHADPRHRQQLLLRAATPGRP